MTSGLTPPKAANRLTHILDAISVAHGTPRFPVDVKALALDTANIFKWPDPVASVQAASLKSFEGCLYPNEDRKKWLLLYNDRLTSKGRIRFTQAHELGHYILHRTLRDTFECGESDVNRWATDGDIDVEKQADVFASYLLIPLVDLRQQLSSTINLESLTSCADRYGVSLTAAILKWLSYTEEKAVLAVSRDGFIDWAISSEPAFKSGAFIRTKNLVVPLPTGSATAQGNISKNGTAISSRAWFPNAETEFGLLEMAVHAEQYDSIITLLLLPRQASAWPRWRSEA